MSHNPRNGRLSGLFPNDGAHRWFKAIVSVALVEESHLLMVQESSGADRHRWNLPGGKLGPAEGLVEAALREAREETGCVIALRGLSGLYQYVNRAGHPCLRFLFLGSATGTPSARHGEINDVRWFHLDQLDAMPDSEFAKPQFLRPMLADIRAGRAFPLELLRELDAAAVTQK